jgi:hypothetical protein
MPSVPNSDGSERPLSTRQPRESGCRGWLAAERLVGTSVFVQRAPGGANALGDHGVARPSRLGLLTLSRWRAARFGGRLPVSGLSQSRWRVRSSPGADRPEIGEVDLPRKKVERCRFRTAVAVGLDESSSLPITPNGGMAS